MPFPLQYSFSDCLVIDIMSFVSDNISSWLTSARNSKGNLGSEGAE